MNFLGALSKAPRIARPATVLCACLATAGAVAQGCKKPEPVTFDIVLPIDQQASTVWFELGIFKGTKCSAVTPQLSGGIPQDGPIRRLAFRADDPHPPALGEIPRDTYSFAAVARAQDCGVLATGCSDVNVHDAKSIKIVLDTNDPPTGACATGSICSDARCVPETDNSDPSVGAGCSLALLGAGPLGDPIITAGAVVSAPAIAATDQGFMIAYREYDPFDGIARLTMIPIDNGGGSLPAQTQNLTTCPGADESDATGLAWNGSAGIAAVSRPSCNSTSGTDLFTIDLNGAITKSGFAPSPDPRVTLSTAHALAQAGSTSLLAFVSDGQAKATAVSGTSFSGNASAFGGSPTHTDGWIAASNAAVALIAIGVDGSGNSPLDAGDGGFDASTPDPGVGPIRFQFVAPNALNSLPAPTTLTGTWASAAVQGKRAIVTTDSDVPGRPVLYRIYDLGLPDPQIVDGLTTAGEGAVLFADTAFHQDHMFFAVERAGSLGLVAFNHATTTPSFLRQLTVGDDPRVPALNGIQDGRVAIAASDTRVAIVWATRKQLTSNDAVGGYAVYACTTP